MDAGNLNEHEMRKQGSLAQLREWGRTRRKLEDGRDLMILLALREGITIEEIHKLTGLGRSTIDRIRKDAAAELERDHRLLGLAREEAEGC